MTKLIDLLNELAVAEAESKAYDEEINTRIANGASEDEIKDLEEKSDIAHLDQYEKFKVVLIKLRDMIGVDEAIARVMIINHRTELVKIAAREV